MAARPSSRTTRALLTGVATSAYYATPDFIDSRTGRALAKTALAGAASAAAWPDARRGLDETRLDEDRLTAEDLTSLPTSGKLALTGVAAVAIAGSLASTVAAERWIFRRGEARAADGVRLPHTRAAILYGALATALSLVPVGDETA